MSAEDTFRFAITALLQQPRRAGLSLLGVVIGVVAVIFLTALGEGARRYVIDQFLTLGTDIIVVIPGKTETTGMIPGFTGTPNDLTLDDARALLRRIPEAIKVALRDAVSQAIDGLLDGKARARHQKEIKQRVLLHSRRFVRTYRVLDEVINTQPAVHYLKKVTFHEIASGGHE